MPRKKSDDSENTFFAKMKESLSGISSGEKIAFFLVIAFLIEIFLLLSPFKVAGVVGETIYNGIVFTFGLFGYWILFLLIALFIIAVVKELSFSWTRTIIGGTILYISSISIVGFFANDESSKLSGIVGDGFANFLQGFFGIYTIAFLIGMFIIGLIISFFHTFKVLPGKLRELQEMQDNRGEEEDEFEIYGADEEEDEDGEEEEEDEEEEEEEDDGDDEEEEEEPEEEDDDDWDDDEDDDEEEEDEEGEEESKEGIPSYDPDTPYTKPDVSLLKVDKGSGSGGDVKARANLLKRTFENFGINITVEEVAVGPTITRFAVKPAENVRLSRILGLQNNLELALAAHPVRIEAPIPGKSLVGIEVPNTKKATVGLGSLIDSKEYTDYTKPLPIVIGKTIDGTISLASVARMPHILIAGTTGSGKSVVMHNFILSLLFKYSPADLRLILVDPKRVELTLYNGIPHLLTEVITQPKKAVSSLIWATKEMERRYNILQENKARDIESYNSSNDEKLPYILIIVDELADLMQTYPRELEGAIVRLAQMSRAVGIHLILSTQRPSVNVITGLIKANIPSRVALQVSSQIDSRTILDTPGAEKLLGSGDLLFLSSEMSKPIRLQSAFVEEAEVKKVVKFIINNNDSFVPELEVDNDTQESTNPIHSAIETAMDDEDADDLYEDAKQVVIEAKKASTSLLQRRLKIGYSRAARLIDTLEAKGIVGPQEGSKPRELLIDPTDENNQ